MHSCFRKDLPVFGPTLMFQRVEKRGIKVFVPFHHQAINHVFQALHRRRGTPPNTGLQRIIGKIQEQNNTQNAFFQSEQDLLKKIKFPCNPTLFNKGRVKSFHFVSIASVH